MSFGPSAYTALYTLLNLWTTGRSKNPGGGFHRLVSLENLFSAWRQFKKGKTKSPDVQAFAFNLEANIFELHDTLVAKQWKPDPYIEFYVRDPKLRRIHKASVRDRVFYQAVFRALYPVFDPLFIHDSYSCRNGKGTHCGVLRLEQFLRRASTNYTKPVYALKCDIRKFFDSIDHSVLLALLRRRVSDPNIVMLIETIIASFMTARGRGLPLGNVTSQLFANIYLNELDQHVKHRLHAPYYLRYCDDFIILDTSAQQLFLYIAELKQFLSEVLRLDLHPNKISIRKISEGVDSLGYIVLPHYRILRSSSRRRMFRKLAMAKTAHSAGALSDESFAAVTNSYRGMLSHAKSHGLDLQVLELANIKS